MSTFLAWLYSAASKVYQFFGSAYTSLYNGAANAWNWAVTQATNALNVAKSYAYQLFQNVSAVAGITVSWVLQQIQSAVNGIKDDILGLFDWVEYKFSTIGDLIAQTIGDVYGSLNSVFNDLRNEFNSLVNSITGYVMNWVTTGFGWLLDIRQSILNIVNLLTVDNINELLNLLGVWKNTVLLFFQNPLRFILDLLQAEILGFLSYVLAWALGTTKYELPKSAPWKR